MIGRVVFVLLGVTVMVVFLGCIVVFGDEILSVIGRVVSVFLGVTVMVVFLGCIVVFGVAFRGTQ